MANKNKDPIYALAEQIIGSSERITDSRISKAQYDKSFAVTILGINQKFTGDVSAEDKAALIEKYSIPSEVEEGDPNYYTVKINGAYYISKQNGNFKLYDKVMAYLPNSNWSRLYLDYPVTEKDNFRSIKVYSQPEEPEDGMADGDLWFEEDNNNNLIALYHYGYNEESEQNEWIFDWNISSGSGTGKFLDSGKTSVSHNDNEHNTSTQLYDNISGYKNSSTGSPTTITSNDIVWNGVNTILGEHNTVTNGTCAVIFGRGNSFNMGGECMVGGEDNVVTAYMGDAMLLGANNVITQLFYALCVGQNITATNFVHGAIFGKNHNISTNGVVSPLVSGDGAVMSSRDNLMFVIGNNGNILTVDTSGNLCAAGSITPGGADYSEMYEWVDSNPDNEDRRGLFVTLDGKYIKPATSDDDYILGVVSATPSICGDTYDLHWKGKYQKDIFGVLLTDDKGNPVLSPEYNPDLEYVPQSLRKEKAKIGTQGKLVVVDDGTCQPNKYCKPSIKGIGTYTDDKNYYRVLERLDDTHIRIVIK